MLTVRLHGHLEEKYGSEFRFEAKTVREVIDALQANFDDFTEEFIKDQRAYNILVDAEAQEVEGCVVPIKTDSTIDIIPIIGGAGFLKTLGLIVIGAVLIIATAGAATMLAGGFATGLAGSLGAGLISMGVTSTLAVSAISAIGWGLALAGVASLLAGPDGPDGGGPESSSLSQVDNIIGQGMPIPVGYGRLMMGSVVLSATFLSSYVQVSQAWVYEDTTTGTHIDYVINTENAGLTDNANTSLDGVYKWNGFPTGYGIEQYAKLIEAAEVNLGGGTYEIVPYVAPTGSTVAVPTYQPRKISGTYIDSSINHK